ncbi:NACHT domain-containing protein [Saccharopolyspora sp. TS4A08]|uniref:NACHT domain-containing protein n=1 Tax=Saccharopolyspora ipomoeae TaxID=3042027 RepID=A0ABT6PIK1_9PSEU|nr:NACHT domain-containing protein [Saccharopolyspora sp. TS4A08]MDI2027772.1 NACHT domain-containing protein [Saccharopolyspora sp. TS4A08]
MQVGNVHGDIVVGPPSSPPSNGDEPADLAAALAHRVHGLSKREDEHRRIYDPRPLPVRWHRATDELFDHWANIHGRESKHDATTLTGSFIGIRETYEAIPSRRLVILGRAGAGKTVLAHRLILALLEDRPRTAPVPILLSLSDWNPRVHNLRTWLVGQLLRDHPFLEKRDRAGHRAAELLANDDWILPVLDGFDEIPQQYDRDAVHEISRFSGPLVVTSRPHEYTQAAAQARALSRAAAIELDNLTPDESRTYLQASTGKTRTAEWDAVFDQLRNSPDATASQNLLPVLTTPLMVTLARAIYNDIPDHHPGELLDTGRFPTRDHVEEHLLGAYLDTIYDPRNDTTRPTGASPPTWTPHRTRRWLGHLATHLTKRDTHDLTWWQLPNTLHRHTRILLIMATGLAFVLANMFTAMLVYGRDAAAPAFGLVAISGITAAGGLAVGLVNELSYFRGRKGREPSRLHFRLRRRGRPKRSLRVFLMKAGAEAFTGLTIGLAIGLATGLEEGLWYVLVATDPDRFGYGFARGLMIGLETGLAIGITNIIVSALGDTNAPEDAISPWQLLATDRTTTLIQTTTTTSSVGLMLGLVAYQSWPWAVLFGCVAGAIRLLLSTWGNWLLFVRLWLPLTGRLPWRSKRFLEDAYQRGALRQPGAVYQFRHAQLRNHLAHQHRTRPHRW